MKHGAVVVLGGSVRGMGTNKVRNHPSIIGDADIRSSCGDHAEISALKRVGVTKGATVYVARVAKNGKPAMSKPCVNCQKALDRAGVKRVVWTVDKG